MVTFDEHFARLMDVEGGFVDHADDPGGATMYGVTEAVAREFGYRGEMRDLPRTTARSITKAQYWDKLRLDKYADDLPRLAYRILDASYNCGWRTTGKWLQRSLNALNIKGSVYPDLTVDGLVGRNTTAAIEALSRYRGQEETDKILYYMITCLQGSHYITLAEKHDKFETFVFGWFDKRIADG